MDFKQSEEEMAVRETLRKFMLDEQMRLWIADAERTHEFPHAFMRSVAKLEFLAMSSKEEYGGAGMDSLSATAAIEEFAYGWIAGSLNILVQNSLAGFAIESFGTEEQKMRILPRMATGELLGCFANTEPDAGSDAKNITTRAVVYEGGWRLTGQKRFCTNASVAGVMVLFARTEERRAGFPGITAFLIDIEKHRPGLVIRPQEKNLQFGSTLCDIYLDEVLVRNDELLGSVNRGWDICERTFQHSRIWIAAQAVGAARRALDEALLHTKTRFAFGKKLIEHQVVRLNLAKQLVAIESAKLLTRKASWQESVNDPNFDVTASMAKYAAAEAAKEIVLLLDEYYGGYASDPACIAAKLKRDALIFRTYEGPSNIQLEIIAKRM